MACSILVYGMKKLCRDSISIVPLNRKRAILKRRPSLYQVPPSTTPLTGPTAHRFWLSWMLSMTIGSTGGLWLSLGPLGTWPINFINLIASTIILGTSFGLPQALVLLYTKRRFSSYPLSILQIRFWLGVWVVAGALLTPGIVLFNTGGIIGAGMIVIL